MAWFSRNKMTNEDLGVLIYDLREDVKRVQGTNEDKNDLETQKVHLHVAQSEDRLDYLRKQVLETRAAYKELSARLNAIESRRLVDEALEQNVYYHEYAIRSEFV